MGLQLTEGLQGRFAVVKLWPTVKVAEDEVIARLKTAAERLGLECIEMFSDGRALAPPHAKVTQRDVDFAIHLHFETPKAYDLYSFAALWNPTRIIHWYSRGEFDRFSRHLASHDDFLSCGSLAADDHVRRMLLPDPTRDGPQFTMYHSLAGPLLQPTLGSREIAYVGINWERMSGTKGRHHELLSLLDKTGRMRIYGPREIYGVRVWEGYQSYVAPLPFDGVSVIQSLHQAGVGLVLASDNHKEDNIMSCRLFETVAAGAVAICDEHPFARQHFGDSVLYIDVTASPEDAFQQIMDHLHWIDANPESAIAMARRAQEIFASQFALDRSLRAIYEGFAARRNELAQRRAAPVDPPTTLFLLLPKFNREILLQHIEGVRAQEQQGVEFVLLVNESDYSDHAHVIDELLRGSQQRIECRPIKFETSERRSRQIKLGVILNSLIDALPEGQLFGFVGPQEQLMSDHLHSLAGCLYRNPDADCAYSDVTLKSPTPSHDGSPVLSFQWEVELVGADPKRPFGLARFLFRKSARLSPARLALPHLSAKSVAALVSQASCIPSRRVTVLSLLPTADANHPSVEEIDFEDNILQPLLPDAEVMRRMAAQSKLSVPQVRVGGSSSRGRSKLQNALRPWIRPLENALRPVRHRSRRVPSIVRSSYRKMVNSIHRMF